jgi:SAM-dependent methyltransferase
MRRATRQEVPDWVVALLRCPACVQPAMRRQGREGLECEACGHRPPVVDGVLDLTVERGGGQPRRDRPYEGLAGELYAMFMDRRKLQHVDAWLLGMDVEGYYEQMLGRLASLSAGPNLELPAGGGPFLTIKELYHRSGPWLLADLSWTMLRRLRRKCEELRLGEVVLLRADACQLPLCDGSLRNLVSPFGLHCFHDKRAVLGEMSRCLARGGRIVASTLTSDGPPRSRLYLRLHEGDGTFARDNSLAELREHARSQALEVSALARFGAAAVLEVRHGA